MESSASSRLTPESDPSSPSLQIPKFKIGLCQLTVTSDKAVNLAKARSMMQMAAQEGAKLVVLPEMWICPYSDDYFTKCAEDIAVGRSSLALCMLSEVASSWGITIVGGSLPEWNDGQIYNTCYVFGPNGKLKAKHRKLHLFDYHAPGDESFMESDFFNAGNTPTIVKTDVGQVGIGICHDICFPELAMLYGARGAQLIIYPGAFNMSSGESLWELETKASCLLLYVRLQESLLDHTQSGAIPWLLNGEIKASAGHEETIVIAEIDYSEIQLQRDLFPLQQKKANVCKFFDLCDRKTYI
ncbi:hypothetical protein Ancab_012589 [Ancistrocladus abbreviatus]